MVCIRYATQQDVPSMLAIYAPYVKETLVSFEYEVPTPQDFAARVKALQPDMPWIVYEEDEKILGYAYASRFGVRAGFDWSAETSVYLDKEAQGKGVGQKLYQILFGLMQAMGYATLYARIAVPNMQSEKFHLKMGFTCEAVLKKVGFKFDSFVDLAYYTLQLCPKDHPLPKPRKLKDLTDDELRPFIKAQL
ncbi:MAG: GNAT family N-acetyltransferase [Oscillospiraceae bacterium]